MNYSWKSRRVASILIWICTYCIQQDKSRMRQNRLHFRYLAWVRNKKRNSRQGVQCVTSLREMQKKLEMLLEKFGAWTSSALTGRILPAFERFESKAFQRMLSCFSRNFAKNRLYDFACHIVNSCAIAWHFICNDGHLCVASILASAQSTFNHGLRRPTTLFDLSSFQFS